MTNLTDFIKFELYPRLFDRIDEAFPRMAFELDGYGWYSPYKFNGERAHDGNRRKTQVTRKVPTRVFEQGDIENSLDLIDFYKAQNGITETIEAVKQLSSICGLTLPPMEGEKAYQLRKEMQDKLEALDVKMRAALFTDEGQGTLDYLKGRGYTEDFIKWAGFGFVSPSIREELRQTLPMCHHDIGITHFLSLPYRTGSRIQGFVFRLTSANTTGAKYLDAFITKTASKKYNLFGLTGLRLTGDKERDKDITIVEGEIDALRAIYAGLPNVVAASGGGVYKEALAEAKKRGVKRVTLLFDYDVPKGEETIEQKQEETAKKIEKAIATIQEAGLTPFVATFPADGEKVDVDIFLLKYPSGDELKNIVYEAVSGNMWLYQRRKAKLAKASPDNGYNPDGKQIEDFTNDTLSLCNSRFVSDIDRTKILSDYAATTNVDIQKAADRLREADLRIKQRQETIDLAAKISKLTQEGKTAEALGMMQDRAKEIQRISYEAEFAKDLIPPTLDDLEREYQNISLGVPTDFAFKGRNGYERFYLPSGALTLICALTSHGKSRMLENLALQLATAEDEGSVIYFTFEEEVDKVRMQFLNTLADVELTGYGRNLDTISELLKTGKSKFVKGDRDSQGRDRLQTFYYAKAKLEALTTSGKLRIYSKYRDGMELSRAIRYYSSHSKVKAVFVDFIQLMRMNSPKSGRKEELSYICDELKELSKDTGLPIVLAAQLNRSTPSPVDMACQNIADATDIEQSANVVMLLWNSAAKPNSQATGNTYYNKAGKLSEEAEKLMERGFVAGVPGKIYAILDKNRGGERYMDAIFDFDGNTGKIKPNLDKVPQRLPAENKQQGQEEPPLWGDSPF
jgi:replicative DNA helicase